MRPIYRWFLSLAATVLAVGISYEWLDRPISLLAYRQLRHHQTFAQLTYIPEPFLPLAIIAFVGLGLWVLAGRPLSAWQRMMLFCSISIIITEATKSQLKFVFGRTWPDTWIQDNPSFIRDGIYGFNPFHGGPGYASFPSGHMAVTCAVVSVLWICYPKLRWLWSIAVLAVAIGLIGANYHFLSDVIAGAFVGSSIGWFTAALWKTQPTRLTDRSS